MTQWRTEEVATLLGGKGTRQGSKLERARVTAFIKRRRLGLDLRSVPKKKRSAFVGHKRHANSQARKVIVSAKRGRITERELRNIGRQTLMAKYRPSLLLGGLLPKREDRWINMATRFRRRRKEAINVQNFSFLHDPNAAIRSLARIARAEAEAVTASIDFNDERCDDIGPWLVLAVLRNDMASIFTGGGISNSVSKVVSALELDDALAMTVSPIWSVEKDIWAYPIKRRRPAGSSTSINFLLDPQAAEKLGDQLCEEVDRWLGEIVGQNLTTVGRRTVKTIVGETLDNAERHGRPDFPDDGDWMVSGMMVRRGPVEAPKFQCQLAFLSVGSSISETIATCPDGIRSNMEEYVNLHRGKLSKLRFAEQHLRTVYALQPGVTRDADAFNEGRGGVGFGYITSFFADLAGIEDANSSARLAIVSGRTCLHIGYPYCTSREGRHELRELWLNEHNDNSEPPDAGCIVELEHELKGTLITMSFNLDRGYLERSINGTY